MYPIKRSQRPHFTLNLPGTDDSCRTHRALLARSPQESPHRGNFFFLLVVKDLILRHKLFLFGI